VSDSGIVAGRDLGRLEVLRRRRRGQDLLHLTRLKGHELRDGRLGDGHRRPRGRPGRHGRRHRHGWRHRVRSERGGGHRPFSGVRLRGAAGELLALDADDRQQLDLLEELVRHLPGHEDEPRRPRHRDGDIGVEPCEVVGKGQAPEVGVQGAEQQPRVGDVADGDEHQRPLRIDRDHVDRGVAQPEVRLQHGEARLEGLGILGDEDPDAVLSRRLRSPRDERHVPLFPSVCGRLSSVRTNREQLGYQPGRQG
jgi:hypothetical protein